MAIALPDDLTLDDEATARPGLPGDLQHDTAADPMSLNDPTKAPGEGYVWSANAQKWLSPMEAQTLSRETTVGMNAARNNEGESGWLQGARSFLRGETAGWGPDIVGKTTGALTGEDGQMRADIERRQDDLNAQEHPTRNMLLHGAGGALGVVGGGAALEGLPVVGPAMDAVGNALNRIGYVTAGGRQVATRAINAGLRAPTSLGTAVATSGLVGLPIGASEEMADQGISGRNALIGSGKGVAGGVVGGTLVHGGSAVAGPWATDMAQRLINERVPLSPGQTMGGPVQWLESMAGSIPFTGGLIRRSTEVGKEGMNRAVLNRAIQPVEQALNLAPRSLQMGDNVAAGHDAFNHAEGVLSHSYDTTLPHVDLNMGGTALNNRVNAVLADATQHLEPNVAQRLDGIVQRNLFTRLANAAPANNPTVAGPDLQPIMSSLRGLTRQYSGSGAVDERQMAYYLRNVVREVNDEIATQNPTHAPILRAIDNGYAALTIARNASTRAGNREGAFTAAALNGAIKNADRSVDHVSMARGQALLQDLGDAAHATIRDFPNSGTPERQAASRMLGGIGAEGGAYVAGHAMLGPAALAPLAVGPAIYNPVSKSIIRGLASEYTQNATPYLPASRTALRNSLRQYAPSLAASGNVNALGAPTLNALSPGANQ